MVTKTFPLFRKTKYTPFLLYGNKRFLILSHLYMERQVDVDKNGMKKADLKTDIMVTSCKTLFIIICSVNHVKDFAMLSICQIYTSILW